MRHPIRGLRVGGGAAGITGDPHRTMSGHFHFADADLSDTTRSAHPGGTGYLGTFQARVLTLDSTGNRPVITGPHCPDKSLDFLAAANTDAVLHG